MKRAGSPRDGASRQGRRRSDAKAVATGTENSTALVPEIEAAGEEDEERQESDETDVLELSEVGPESDGETEPTSVLELEPVDGPEVSAALVPMDSLQRYLGEIRRYPLLDPEEEHRLAVRWREEGDRAAATRLATANLRLVVMIARQYQKAFKNLIDLVQEGNIGLLEAVKNFDPYRGVRFPSYAAWWIRAYIIRFVMNNWRLVKLGTTQAQRKLFFNLQREKERLERQGFRPDPALIAERLSVKPSEVVDMEQRMGGRDVSVDAPIGPDGDASMLDFLPDRRDEPEARFGEAQVRDLVAQKIREFGETLHDKEKLIFDQRMIAEDPLTLQDIGEKYGISRERVRQIEERIKRRLRDFLVSEMPDINDVDVRLNLGTGN